MRKLLHIIIQLPHKLLILLVRGYQLVISPHLAPSCRFAPSCSVYAIQALQKYGALKGTILAVYRVLRCNPWGGHGYDPPRWFGEPVPDDFPVDHVHSTNHSDSDTPGNGKGTPLDREQQPTIH